METTKNQTTVSFDVTPGKDAIAPRDWVENARFVVRSDPPFAVHETNRPGVWQTSDDVRNGRLAASLSLAAKTVGQLGGTYLVSGHETLNVQEVVSAHADLTGALKTLESPPPNENPQYWAFEAGAKFANYIHSLRLPLHPDFVLALPESPVLHRDGNTRYSFVQGFGEALEPHLGGELQGEALWKRQGDLVRALWDSVKRGGFNTEIDPAKADSDWQQLSVAISRDRDGQTLNRSTEDLRETLELLREEERYYPQGSEHEELIDVIEQELAERDSLAEAKAIARHVLGPTIQVKEPQRDSGIYQGPIIGVAGQHIVQALSGLNAAAIVHLKDGLSAQPESGKTVVINYSNGFGNVREVPDRSRGRDLGR